MDSRDAGVNARVSVRQSFSGHLHLVGTICRYFEHTAFKQTYGVLCEHTFTWAGSRWEILVYQQESVVFLSPVVFQRAPYLISDFPDPKDRVPSATVAADSSMANQRPMIHSHTVQARQARHDEHSRTEDKSNRCLETLNNQPSPVTVNRRFTPQNAASFFQSSCSLRACL